MQTENFKKINISTLSCKESDFIHIGYTIRKRDGCPIADDELPFVCMTFINTEKYMEVINYGKRYGTYKKNPITY